MCFKHKVGVMFPCDPLRAAILHAFPPVAVDVYVAVAVLQPHSGE